MHSLVRCYVSWGSMIGMFEHDNELVVGHMRTCDWGALRMYDLNRKSLRAKCACKGG